MDQGLAGPTRIETPNPLAFIMTHCGSARRAGPNWRNSLLEGRASPNTVELLVICERLLVTHSRCLLAYAICSLDNWGSTEAGNVRRTIMPTGNLSNRSVPLNC